MKKSEDKRKDGVKRVKFDHDTPANVKTSVDEKRRSDGVKKITITRK